MRKSESQTNIKKNSNSNLNEQLVNEYNRTNTFENNPTTGKQSLTNFPQNINQNNPQISKLWESEETYYYNNTNSEFELGNLKASKNSVATRNEDSNNLSPNNTTNNFHQRSNNSNNTKDQMAVYVKCLEQKVRDQAARLSDAELYRFLCEKRIMQLNPQQTFPITESHLNSDNNNNNDVNENPGKFSSNNSNRSGKKSNNFIPPSATQGNFYNNNNLDLVPIEQFNELMEKYEKLKNEKDFIKENNINFNNLYDKHNEFNEIEQDYYSIDSFDENEIKRKYKKLFLYFKKIVAEKNNFIELFRKEKAYSEEAKKESMLLKESLENEIVKFGFENELFTSDKLLDLNKFKAEIELVKRECGHYKNLTENYYHEIENLKNINQMLLKNKEKIMQSFEEGLKDLDEMKEKIIFLEKENSALISQLNSIISIPNNDKTLRPYNSSYSNLKETVNCVNNHNNNDTIYFNENVFRRNANNSKSKNKNNKNDEFSNDLLDRNREEDNISVRSNTSVISKTKRVTITKHNRNKSDDNNLNYIKTINENTNNDQINNDNNNTNYNNNKEYEFPKHDKEANFPSNNKNSDFNPNKARAKSSLSQGKLIESTNSRNNFYSSSNNNFHTSNSNEILLHRITEYKKNYEKLNGEFEELLKIKSALEIENANINNHLNSLREKYNFIEKAFEEKQNEVKEYWREKDKWSKDLANLLNKINEMSTSGNSDSNLLISLKEYRRLYEEISLEYEELKTSSRKKINNQGAKMKIVAKELKDKNNLIEKLDSENYSLKKELDCCRSRYELIDNEKQFLNDNEKVKDKELSLANETAERLKKQYDALSASNKNLEKEIEDLRNEKNFLKQKFEKEINSKDREIDELKLLYDNAKKENLKIKEAKKDATKLSYSNYISQEIETLNNQLNEYIVKEKEYSLALLKLEKLEKENEMLNKISEEAKKNRVSLENQIADLVSIKESLEKEVNYLRKNTEFSDDLYNEKNKEIEKFKKIISNLKTENSELESKINNVIRENEKIEEKNFDLQNDFNRKKDSIENLYQENLMLNDKIAVYKVNLNSLFGELKVNLNKLNHRANEDLDSLLTKEFSKNVLRIVSILNNFVNNNYDEKSIFELTKDIVNVFLNEFESIYEKLLENNAYMQDCNQRLVLMEDKLHDRDEEFTEVLQTENQFKNKIRSMHEETLNLNEYIKNLKEQIEILRKANYQGYPSVNNNYGNEGTHKKTATDKKFYTIPELNNIKTSFDEESTYFERNRINESFADDLKKENTVLKQELDKNRKEKLSFYEFLQVLVKNFPCKVISKMLQDLLTGKDQLNKFENETLKIEQKINSLENEYKKLESDDSSNKNQDLIKVIKTEKENLKNLQNEYINKIAEKKEQMKNIEKDIAQNIIRVKEIFDSSRENQENYKFLFNELHMFKEKLENIKIENQCRNELSNILKESFGKLNDFLPKFNSEENYVKSNFDMPMQYNNINNAYNYSNEINSNRASINDSNTRTDLPLNNPLMHKNFKKNFLPNNNETKLINTQNPLLNRNQARTAGNISHLNTFTDGKSLLNQNAFNALSPNKTKVFGSLKSNNVEIACLESNLFSEMSCNTSRVIDSKKMDFPRQNINFSNDNSNSACQINNTNKANSINTKELKTNNLLNNFKQNSVNHYNGNQNYNSGEYGYKDIQDLTKYESLQYDYSASFDLKKIESREFNNLARIEEEGREYSNFDHTQDPNKYPELNSDWNYAQNSSRGFNKKENYNNHNIKEIYSNNRKMEIAKFNEKIANNFTKSNNNSNYSGHFHNNNLSNNK